MTSADVDSFAKEVARALNDLGIEWHNLIRFKRELIRNDLIPAGLTAKTEISAAIAIWQKTSKGATLDEAAALVCNRLAHLPQMQENLPPTIKIDYVHDGAIHYHTEHFTEKAIEILRSELETQGEYGLTTEKSLLHACPLLQYVGKQFAIDFHRSIDFIFKINGKIDEPMRDLSNKLYALGETSDEIKNQWLVEFMNFFDNDKNVVEVVSNYACQTTFGSIYYTNSKCELPKIIAVGDSKAKLRYTIELNTEQEPHACEITAVSEKTAKMLSTWFPDKFGAMLQIREDGGSHYANNIEEVKIKFHLDDMRKKIYKPEVLSTRFYSAFECDWQAADNSLKK